MRKDVALGSGGVKSVPNDWMDGPVIYFVAIPLDNPTSMINSLKCNFILFAYYRKSATTAHKISTITKQ